MRRRCSAAAGVGLSAGLALVACAERQVVSDRPSEAATGWTDPSPHQARYVPVDEGVRLEVLDWGGSGRAVVLLAGSGNTAHVYDELAPLLRDCCHVYGITRRGFGASSQPSSGYEDQRLADDVLAVLASLRILKPVLAGHSMAGGELTTLGHQHSNRLAGLVYLDAIADPVDAPIYDPGYMSLIERLPAAKRPPPALDYSSFAAYRASQMTHFNYAFPEAELRNGFHVRADDGMGRFRTPPEVFTAIGAGQGKRDYSRIRVPVLAFLEFPRPTYDPRLDGDVANDAERAAIEAAARATAVWVQKWMDNFTASVPDARLIDVTGAGHYLFLTRPSEVIGELKAFVTALK